jgi:hypothetical protein
MQISYACGPLLSMTFLTVCVFAVCTSAAEYTLQIC